MKTGVRLVRFGMGVCVVALGAAASQGAWVAGRDMAANEVSATELSNPNGQVPAWSYGWRASAASDALTLFSGAQHFNGSGNYPSLQGWSGSAGPTVEVNVGPNAVTTDFGFGANLTTAALEIMMHPAQDNSYSVVRWTAPARASYAVVAAWHDIDPHGGNGASGDLVVNGAGLFHTDFNNGGTGAPTGVKVVTVPAGGHVDFLVGSRGEWGFDTTGFDATVRVAGDANDNGRVDADDFALTDRGAAKHLTGWGNGDFNADGAVNTLDFQILNQSFAVQTGAAEVGGVLAAVTPDPAGMVVCCSGAILMASRRKREGGRV